MAVLLGLAASHETMPQSEFFVDGNAEKMIWTQQGWVPWRVFCRGGAQPDQSDTELLQGLKALLSAHSGSKGPKQVPDRPSKGKGKGKNKVTAGTERKVVSTPPGSDLLEALKRIVTRADKNPAGLLQRLGTLVSQATAGKKLRPSRANRRARAKENKTAKGKAAGKGSSAVQASFPSVSAKGKGQSAASWVEVAKKGRQVTDKRKPSSWRLDTASGAVLSGSQARQRIQDDVAINAQWIYVPDAREAQRLLDFARVHDCKAIVGVV